MKQASSNVTAKRCTHPNSKLTAGAIALFAIFTSSAVLASAPACAPPETGEPIFITEECLDPLYTTPIIDVEEWRDTPVRHYYVNGHFERPAPGQPEPRFSLYFPEPDKYSGRFFHYTNPTPGSENAAAHRVAFGLANGAYFVQTNGGGGGQIAPLGDSTIPGYRVDAAAAKYSRVKAAEIYGDHRPYGYRYGGSGGGFKTMAGAENSSGVWDGSVPYVIGSPMAIPNVYSIRGHALRHLRRENGCGRIADAVEPGGSGDIYAGLSAEARAAVEEATRFGFPPRAWFECETMGLGALPIIAPLVQAIDSQYFVDFWSVPGYLGADPNSSIHEDRTSSPDNSDALAMQTYHRHQDPAVDRGFGFRDDDFRVWDQFRDSSGAPLYPQRPVLAGPLITGTGTVQNGKIHGKMIVVQTMLDIDALPWQADWYKGKVEAHLGNRLDDQFRLYFLDNADHGENVRPSRQTHIVPFLPALEQALLDVAAWAERGVKPPASTRYQMVDGQVQIPAQAGARKGIQSVVDLRVGAARPSKGEHKQKGKPQALSCAQLKQDYHGEWASVTGHTDSDEDALGQRGRDPQRADDKRRRDSGKRVDVVVGQPVTLCGSIRMAPRAGKVVGVEWNLEGDGFTPGELRGVRPSVRVGTVHTFSAPGTYFPVLRAISHREGDTEASHARIQNIDRVRVVVHPQ